MSKTILITGTSSGFGRDTAETLRRAGHTVYASMRGVQGKNREAEEALRKLGIKTVELDVSDDTSVEAGVKTVMAESGKIDVLVNNAGIASAGVTEAFTTEQATAIFDTNVIGLLRVTRAVLPSMRQQHDGLIINIGSILGRVTFPFVGIYGASKFAVEALTDSLRYEVSRLGVEVVEVQPSGYPTNFFTNIQTPAGIDVTKSYGEVGHIPDAMVTSLTATFEGKDAPNPHDVAEAIVKLVAQAKGSRAVRTVVGHLYGGAVITVAGSSEKVTGLVYVAGVAPDEGESVNDLQSRFPSLAMGPLVRPAQLADGSVEVSIDPARFHDVFCADVPDAEAAFMAISQRPVSATAFDDPATAAAWRTKPSWAVFGTADYPVAPELHRFSYDRADSTVTEVEGASHFLMLSQPDIVAGVIREAVIASAVNVAA